MSDNYVKDFFKDVLRHTHGLGIFEMAKIRGTNELTEVETVDADKTVIVKGQSINPVVDFADATIGLSRMGVLQGFINYPGFDAEDATVEVVTQDRNGTETPIEVKFKDTTGTDAHYRFMLADVINQQLKSMKFKGAEFDINIIPSAKNLKDLGYFNTILASYEAMFSPSTDGNQLFFSIGDGISDRAKVLISNIDDGNITSDLNWSLDVVLKILRLGNSGNCVLSINNQGLLQIKVDSGLGIYTYLLPTKS